MKLATLASADIDGQLVVVSEDAARYLPVEGRTLQQVLERWSSEEPVLSALAERLAAGQGQPLDPAACRAPLPRAWQWLDGSVFPSHGALMQTAFGLPPIETTLPLMYQGMSDRFLGPLDDVPLPSEDDGIDFEAEFGVITDAVPMGVSAADAAAHIRLIVQINDWSLRKIAPIEMKTGFGWIQAKPACSMAPFAVTPETLGAAWTGGQVGLPLIVELNGVRFGAARGDAMAFSFPELIAHAARTRSLPAGTIIGSGTVSNPDFRIVGSSCIAERRGMEMVDEGAARTPFMQFGDHVRMEARDAGGGVLFGAIDQRVVQAG
ncbi:MAG TPA: fumarylacetoacetate hydrolase family protein [Sphingomicrobium sp.]|jgi:fumarylacetoacetate (FAA) hydrolase